MSKLRGNKSKIYWLSIAAMFVVAIILNVLAWVSRSFCDAYIRYIFPMWGRIYGLFTGLTDISVGEIMLYLAAVLVFLFLVALIWLAVIRISGHGKKMAGILWKYVRTIIFIVAMESVIMTLNCYILYHGSTFEEKYLEYSSVDKEYTIEELASVRDYVIAKAEELAVTMPRDDAGNIIYNGDMGATAIAEMKKMGEKYPQLAGYYGYPKAFATSDFFSQQYIMGYYFPFSMEANYNDVMYIANIPATMCHELSHTKGFIYEDEANFISFLACKNSDDDFFRYSGYLSVLGYLNNDLWKSLGEDRELYMSYTQTSELVKHDSVFLTEEAWKEVEKDALIDTEVVKDVSNAFIDTNLKMNGIEQGSAMYGEVVGRVLDYYMNGMDADYTY